VTQHASIQLVNRLIEVVHRLQTLRADSDNDDTSVLDIALASAQPSALHPVQQASDVWVASYHAFGDFAACKPHATRAPQDPQNVVLGGGKAVLLEQSMRLAREAIVGTSKRKHRLLFQAGEGLRLLDLGFKTPAHHFKYYSL
jgi:hypothetical protein